MKKVLNLKKTLHRPLARNLRISLGALAISCFALTSETNAVKTARVFVDSEASTSYNARKESENGAEYETYVFIKGKSYGAGFKDKSLTVPTFEEVVDTLAENMKDRNYYPSASPDQGDLLIVVHYGSTMVEQDLEDLFMLDATDPYADQSDPETFSEVYSDTFDDISDLDDIARANVAKHANSMDNRRLGIGRALERKNINQTEEFDLLVELEDERYFIIMMAYDYEKLRENKEKELLWTTRFSVPAIGTNFVDAYPALARAAREYYGTSLEKYAKSRTHFGTGTVDIGELETVGIEGETEDNPEK